MTISDVQEAPPAMKRSRAKIWIRTGILAVFGTLFTLTLYGDVASGMFRWPWALMTFLPCWVIGFWMRRLVPMRVHPASQCITMSFDRIYFAIIWLLVIAKAITGRAEGMTIWTDVIMCVILGLMVGRLSGICLRVRDLKIRYDFCGQARESGEQPA